MNAEAPETRAPAGADLAELLRRCRVLELAARRNAAGLPGGSYVTSFPGRGLLFHESRKYVPGEPVRHIDWNITARLQEPYVKVHLEERQREVFIALDVSPSMHLGSTERTKLELAVEVAATLAVSAVDSGDRLGHVIFADRVLDQSRPRGGRTQLFRVLRALLAHTGPWTRPVRESDPRTAIHAIQVHRGRRFVVFLISDFIDHNLPDDLRYVRARHDVSLIHVYDPLELEPPGAVVFRGISPEGAPGRQRPRPSPIQAGETGGLEEMRRFLEDHCGPLRLAVTSISTADPVELALGHFFYRKRRRFRS